MKSTSRSPQNTKLWRRLLKSATVHGVCFGLITMPSAVAQDSGLKDAAKGAFQIIQSGMNQMMQQRQAAMQQAMMQAQINQLQPQKVPSKYYPQCAVSKAVTDFPEGACEGPISPADLSSVDAFKFLAVNYESFYENLLAKNQNSTMPVGIQCIEEANRRTEVQLQDKINALNALIGEVRKQTQTFEQEAAKIKEEMDINKDLLYGPIRNADVRATNLLADFSPACQNYYKNGGKGEITKGGFSSLRDTVETHRNQAATFTNNKNSYVNDLKNQLNTIRSEVAKTGIGIMNSEERLRGVMSIGGSTFNFGSAGTIISSSIASFQNDFSVIQRDLAKVGYNISTEDMNGDFNQRMSRFKKGAKEYFMKEAVNNCVNGAGATGIGLTTDQILNGLRHRRASGSSTTLAAYKTALNNILESDAFIEDKMNAIATLDKKYGVGEVYIQVAGADADSSSMTPYGLYVKQIETCKARVEQDDTFSTSSTMREYGSIAERIADAERAMQKAINLEANFLNELTTGIYDRVVNCEGIQSDASRCDYRNGGAEVFATQDPKFCISHATNCATEVTQCYQEADKIVQTKQAKMKALASTFNERVSRLVAQQEFFLNQIKSQVVNDAEFIKRFIPGSLYSFPDDLFIDMPEEAMVNDYGVALRGGGNLDSLVVDLPKKLETLKGMLEGQRLNVTKHLGDYLKDQAEGMQKDAQKWTALKEKCNAAIEGYNQQVAQQNQAGAEADAKAREADALAQTFCQKYSDAAMNPAAGCGKADDLAKEVYEVSGSLANSAGVRQAVQDFQYHCKQANNEGEESDDDRPSVAEKQFEAFEQVCNSRTSDENLHAYIKDQIEDQLDDIGATSDERAAVMALLRNPADSGRDIASSTSLSTEFKGSDFIKKIVEPYVDMLRGGENITISKLDIPDNANITNREDLSQAYEEINQAAEENVGYCKGLYLSKKRSAVTFCANNLAKENCMEDKMKELVSPREASLREMATVAANLNRRVVASESARLGEQMHDNPCVAQQGYNGARGGNAGPGSILDMTGMDIINQAMGF